jgi:large subunit ribosomal protein L25
MAERAVISAAPRTVLGKKVKTLRKAGILPGNVYGNGIASTALQMDTREFVRNVRAAGIRSMFELKVEGEPEPRYVILRGLTRQGGMGEPMHVDFYQVDLRVPIQTTATLRLVGEAPAVRDLAGTLLQNLETVGIRCLPLSIPEALEVDVSILKSFDMSITVADLVVPEGVEFLTDPSVVIATVNPPRIRLTGLGEEGGDESASGDEGAGDGDSEE